MSKRITTYGEFWPFYLGEHTKPVTRGLHYFGTTLGVALLIVALASRIWWLIAVAVVSGYLFAWIGHFFVEKNRPATFTYPWWSFISDFRMLGTWLSGGLAGELSRHKIGATPGKAASKSAKETAGKAS